MAMLTIFVGAGLAALGVGGYFFTGMASWTALIPAFVGLPLGALGLAALKPERRKFAMHAASGLALLGFLGSAMGILKVFKMLAGESVKRPEAAISQAIMALLCLIFLALAVKSFISARRRRTEAVQASV